MRKFMRGQKVLFIFVLTMITAFCASTQNKKIKEREKELQHQYELGVVAMKYGLLDEAIKYLNNALSLDPNHYPSYYLQGLIHVQRQNFVEAIVAFQRCLELKPDHSEAHVRLGLIYQEMGSSDKAEEEFKKSYAIDARLEASFNLAMLYYKQKKLDQALEYIQKTIEKKSNEVAAYNLQGVILNDLGRYSEAVESFRHVLRLDPNHIVGSINLAVAYINNQNYKEARELLEKLLPRIEEQELKNRINEYLEKIKDREMGG